MVEKSVLFAQHIALCFSFSQHIAKTIKKFSAQEF